MALTHTVTVGLSLGRIRRAIFVCSLAIGIGLIGQTLAWSFITFTDIRWEEPEQSEATPLIVSNVTPQEEAPELDPADAIRGVTSTQNPELQVAIVDPVKSDPEETLELSAHDATMKNLVGIGKGIGTMGMIALLPLIMLSTLLAAATGVAGGERLISVFNLSLILALLILPLGEILSLPWREGALMSYEFMAIDVEMYRNTPSTAYGPFVYFSRFLVLPMACVVGTMLMYLRFSSCVDQAVLAGDTMRVDPAIEAEASSIKVGAQNSRTASALDRIAERAEQKQHIQEDTLTKATRAQTEKMSSRII